MKNFFFFFLFSFLKVWPLYANLGSDYGLGSRISALGKAGGTTGFAHSFNVYHNPSSLALPLEHGKLLQMDYALVWMKPSFIPIRNVVIQNAFNEGKVPGSPTYGDIDTSYQAIFGHSFGATYLLFPQFFRLTVGALAFFPIDHLAYFDTGDSLRPEYLLYRTRSQNPQFNFALGMNGLRDFYFGLGFQVAYTMTSRSDATLSATVGSPTLVRTLASMKPHLVPYFGFLWAPHDGKVQRLGFVVRLPARYDHFMYLDSYAKIAALTSSSGFLFQLKGDSTFLYDPLTCHLGASWKHPWGQTHLDLEYQFWRDYISPIVVLQSQQGMGSIEVQPGFGPSVSYRSRWVPQLGEEIQLSDQTVLRFGYRYHASIIQSLPLGAGNLLDPPKHLLSAGVGFLFQKFLGHAIPHRLDFHVVYHALVTQKVVKTPGNEKGDLADLKVGAPGYEVGGALYGGGASLSFVF